jgi:O-antigen ligase
MSKTAIIILIALTVLRQFYGPQKRIRLLITSGIFLSVVLFAYLKFQPSEKENTNDIEILSKIKYNNAYLPIGYRTIIWDCALKISSQSTNKLFGIGFKETSNQLVSCYGDVINDEPTKQKFITKRFNTHNQYIDFYLSSGLVSLILFISVLLFLLIKYHDNFYPTALIVTIILFGMVENYFHRQVGAYYIGFILVILLINYPLKEPINNKIP